MKLLPFLAAASIGPVMVNVLGYDVPVLSALLSVAGVILASLIAKPPPLKWWQRAALIGLLCILVLALVISDPTRSLMVSTCWAIGIGYSGLPIIQAITGRVLPAVANAAVPAVASPAPEPNVSSEEQIDAPHA